MSLFQTSVINKYLKTQNKQTIQMAYSKFKMHFHNATIQENIRNSKEEQYQGEFLIDLFVNILGYVKNPTPDYNLTSEYKNVKDSKKADGVLIIGNVVKAVIELKGTNTTDLGNVEIQAFGYKNNQPECVYVITSNFEKLRFYIDNAIEYIEFNLFTLTEKEFELLYMCLAYQSIEKDLPKKIKDESISQEDKITKQLYNDYSQFKRELHQNLVALNPDYDTLVLFKKSQKLLDRFLFLFFAEDRQLLPPNSVRMILNQWETLRDLDEYNPLYSRFKKYFGYLNTGYKGKQYDVFAYNGGLFKPDTVLDNVKIDDDLLYRHTLKLSDYDFESEVDVNILGHIFEQSLDESPPTPEGGVSVPLSGAKGLRKKEGVFYTPKYITKYIVDNTVGKLCIDKKAELGIVEDFTLMGHAPLYRKTKQALFDKLTAYRDWLLQITICDPACGSGAFLNQALNFLIDEHRTIDEMQAKLFGDELVLSDIENTILENNLFGVDLNEESVEIAKLSLWLRTAQPNRKLNDLSNNIKCGNSLIDDPAVAGDKAFNWEQEFPQVFGHEKAESVIVKIEKEETPDYLQLIKAQSLEAQTKAEQAIALSKEAAEISRKVYEYAEKLEAVSEPESHYGIRKGGFDVVIGNPPYVRLESIKDVSEALSSIGYKTFEKRGDLYCLFVERGFEILKPNGIISFIMPNKWMQAGYGKALRQFLLRYELNQLIDFGDKQIFEGATTYPCIFVSRKSIPHNELSVSILAKAENDDFYTNVQKTAQVFETSKLSGDTWILSSNNDQQLIERLKSSFKKLYEVLDGEAFRGIIPGLSEAFIIDEETKNKLIQKDVSSNKIINPIVRGRNMQRYRVPQLNECDFIILAKYGSYQYLESDYPAIYERLLSFEEDLKKRGQCNGSKPSAEKPFSGQHHWLELDNCPADEYLSKYSKPKIMYQVFQVKPCFIYDEHGLFCNNSMWFIPTDNRALIGILNSKMGWWLINKYCTQIQNGVQLIWKYFGQIPIANTSIKLANKADLMLSLNKDLQEVSGKFQRTMQRKFRLDELSGKLQKWYQLTYSDFIAELSKKKVKLSLTDEAEWESYFVQEADKVIAIKNQLETTDREIDQMVYSLYGLTEEEKAIVEAQ